MELSIILCNWWLCIRIRRALIMKAWSNKKIDRRALIIRNKSIELQLMTPISFLAASLHHVVSHHVVSRHLDTVNVILSLIYMESASNSTSFCQKRNACIKSMLYMIKSKLQGCLIDQSLKSIINFCIFKNFWHF